MNAKLPILLLSAACLTVAASAASPWSVRLGATYLQTTDGSSNKAVQVDIEDKLIPELDVSYAFNAHWSADLVLTIPQEHEVKVNGTKVGTFKHLPPTLLAKYNFSPIGGFTPYLGAGVNFTLIFDDNLLGGFAKLDNYSVGPAGQAGFDYKLNEHWSLNVDIKRVMLRTDVKVGPATLTEARLDPWLYSLGLRYQF
jgi:outer membrane protein